MIILGLFFTHIIAIGAGWVWRGKYGASVKAAVDEVL